MAPLSNSYRAVNEITGEELFGLASDIAKKLGTTAAVVTQYAFQNRKFKKKWSFSKEYEFVMSDKERKEWETTCKPFREVSKRKREK